MATIEFNKVAKRFGEVSVIEDFNLTIKDEEFMVLVGPSGCGKSTALRMIAGLEALTEGELRIGGRLVNDVQPKDRDVAMVFQSYALYPHMTVRENMSFGLRIRKLPKPEIARMVDEAAEILGLTPLLERKPMALSGGQRQRVALGRAIVRKPSVFLFDEPLSNLDAKLRVQMRAELSKLQGRLKTTTVYVTHDQIEAMTLGHRIAVMAPMGPERKSNLKQVGTPLELYDSPANVFVATFIGTPPMNVVDVTVSADGRQLEHPAFSLAVPPAYETALAVYRGERVVLGIRPEHVAEAAEHDWNDTVALAGTIEIVETIGHEVNVHILAGEEMIIAKFAAHRIPAFGERIEVVMKRDAIHLFDAQTEERLC